MRATRASVVEILIRCAIALVVAACVPAAEAQPRDEAFKAGLDARQAKRWAETATHMRRAIQADPKEDERKVRRGIGAVFGSGGHEYLPHYYLAEALFNLGDCVGAVDAWSVSELQGVVRSRADYVSLMEKGYVACEQRGVLPPAKYAPLLGRTRQILNDVTALARTISSTGEAHVELWRPEIREQYDRASGELQNAGVRFVTATRNRAERDFAEAAAAADRARNILKGLDAQLKVAIEAKTASQAVAAEIDGILRQAEANDRALDAKKAILTAAPSLAAARRTAADALARIRSQVAAPSTRANIAALNDLRAVADDTMNKLKSLLDEVAKIEKSVLARRFAEVVASAEQSITLVADGFGIVEQRAAQNPALLTPEMVTERDIVREAAAKLQRRFETSRRMQNISGVEEATRLATQLRARLDALIQRFGALTIVDRGIRPALAEGARLFLAGKYQETLDALDPSRLGEIPHQLHVHLFRAAALHGLWVRKGGTDQALHAQALGEVERCKLLTPGFQPDPRAFGPRFVSFFQSPRPPPTPAAAPSTSQP